MREEQRAHRADRGPGEEDEPEQEDEDSVPITELEGFGSGLSGGGPDSEAAGRRFEPVGVELAPERERGGDDEPEGHEPEEDPECDAARDEAASQVALALQHLAKERRARQRLGPRAHRREPLRKRRRSGWALGAHPLRHAYWNSSRSASVGA
ncbi:MAG: hypothetical protein ACRDQT_00375 [Gaiellaceae bacterium]